MKKNHLFIAIAVSFFITGCSAINNSLADDVNTIMADYSNSDGPGYAIGVVENGALIFSAGYGEANVETGALITPNTPFNLASLSKQFTGGAVAIEIINGKLSLDDKFEKHWPNLPAFMSDITIAHLVYMTSGLPEYYTLPAPNGGWSSEDRFTVKDAISAVFDANMLEYDPGTKWSYSNINYQLLAETVARKHETIFSKRLDEILFRPLGMNSSWADDEMQHRSRDSATSYERDSTGSWRPAPRLSPHYGGSGVFSSLKDLAKWDRALHDADIIATDFGKTMLMRRRFDHSKDNDAFGLVHGEHEARKLIWYEGGDYGVSSYMARIVDAEKTVICLANFANAGCRDIAFAIIDTIEKK